MNKMDKSSETCSHIKVWNILDAEMVHNIFLHKAIQLFYSNKASPNLDIGVLSKRENLNSELKIKWMSTAYKTLSNGD